MRKAFLCLILIILMAAPALAQTVSVDGAYTLALPDDLKAAELTEEELASGLRLDMSNDALRAVVYEYDPDPNYPYTVDDMYDEYLGNQEEGLLASAAIEEIGGERMLVYDSGDGTIGAKTVAKDGKTYEFLMICQKDSARDAAKAAIESIKAA